MCRIKRLCLRGGGTLKALLTPIFKCKHKAFTLAEMMVVMLILSIVLAAMAPVVTTRSKVDQSSPWRYSEGNLSDAYYGLGESQTAMIGQREFTNTDETAKLIINSNSTRPSQIAFKRDGLNQGVLRLENSTTLLGSLNNGSTLGSDSLGIGKNIVSSGSKSVAIGSGANATGTNSISIGQNSEAQFLSVALGNAAKANSTSGGNSAVGVAIGSNAKSTNTAAIAIGSEASASGSNSIAMGQQSEASGIYSTAIGMIAKAAGSDSIAIGVRSDDRGAQGNQSIAIGYLAGAISDYGTALGASAEANEYSTALGTSTTASSTYSTAIGNNATASNTDAVAIGSRGVTASGESSVAIGSKADAAITTASGSGSIAIGDGAVATGDWSVALGTMTEAKGLNNVALGVNACKGVTGSNKTCIGANSGPSDSEAQASDNSNVVYIGTTSSTVYIPGNLVVGKDLLAGARSVNDNANYKIYLKGGNKGAYSSWVYLGTDDYKGGDDNFYKVNPVSVGPYNIYDNTSISSDRRLKYIGKEFTSGLDKIRQLNVFNYTFKKDETKTPHVGVMAQDLQKIFPNAVKKGADGFLTIRMEDMFYAVINAIKELDAKITAQDKKIKELESRLEKLEAKAK